jgi:hypothetical protein
MKNESSMLTDAEIDQVAGTGIIGELKAKLHHLFSGTGQGTVGGPAVYDGVGKPSTGSSGGGSSGAGPSGPQ